MTSIQQFCRDGGKIVWADDASLAAFRALGDAYIDQLKTDPPTRVSINLLELLFKQSLPAARLPDPCGDAQ
ncbi:hypothetical protein RBS60_02080 [Sinomonas sp. ASV486]|uniref:hypothetical protein n=1 Tax=Sinomonas sp. ASV486 TaxID=3051170 RepID=UPI0027DE304A|nr:hypothetical protein [Sinomonas sp. ASV486]MDQ4488983.1 hypothetical protein [Sinomonas sp. ASV486]